MKHVEIEIKNGMYKATIKQGGKNGDLVISQTIEAESDTDIQVALMEQGFHQRDIFDALAIAEGKGANAPHPFFEEALAKAKKRKK